MSRQNTKPKNVRVRKLRIRLVFLHIGSFIITILPLVVLMLINFDKYVDTTPKAWKFTIGGMLALVLITMKALDKLKFPNRIVGLGVVMVLTYLLQALLDDILLLLFMAFIGEFIDLVAFKTLIKKYKAELEREKTGDIVAEKVEAAVKKYITNGRV